MRLSKNCLYKGDIILQKLGRNVIEKMIKMSCTGLEINFILVISQYQDDRGRVRGVYYKDICQKLNMSYQAFYDVKMSLAEKRIIRATKEYYSDWEITILDNEFADSESFKKGYLNTGAAIFSNLKFMKLKAKEKLLAMIFMMITYARKGFYHIGVVKFYDKYTQMLQVSKRVIQNYMTSLREFFSIGLKDKHYWISPLKNIYKAPGEKTGNAKYNDYIGKVIFRRAKINHIKKTFQDTVGLLKQYRECKKEALEDIFEIAVNLSIEMANENIRNKRYWNRILQPKLVHKLFRKLLGIQN